MGGLFSVLKKTQMRTLDYRNLLQVYIIELVSLIPKCKTDALRYSKHWIGTPKSR
jgi:hypothetical protein